MQALIDNNFPEHLRPRNGAFLLMLRLMHSNFLLALELLFYYIKPEQQNRVWGINHWQYFIKQNGGFTPGHREYANLLSTNVLLHADDGLPVCYKPVFNKF